ncbi:hypothetical protein BP6252_01143 [Coleophoma cylindrospora]|uniref:FAD-binding FR-type domain-containing protein n=1 Tax=Coleophoma cylindrospora TaxID=1849047 RepID=A0A3D8SSF8_9HELO|nr:hypothetical protein BP6252_01143 [Coleophoma cylindrospora]
MAVSSCRRYSTKYNGTKRTKPASDGSAQRSAEFHEAQQAARKTQKVLSGLLALAILAPTAWYLPQLLSQPSTNRIFDPPRFTPFTVIAREVVSPTSILITIRPNAATFDPEPYRDSWAKGPWSVEIKQPELQIARSYTPLPPSEDTQDGDLRFLIRREHKGEVSGYLHSLGVGATVQLRGPHSEIELPEGVTDVVFLAGGTGIAPALQIAHTLLDVRSNQENRKPKVRIVWANRRREDCMGGKSSLEPGKLNFWTSNSAKQEPSNVLVKELEALQRKHAGSLTVDYLVDEESTFLDQKKVMQLTKTTSDTESDPQLEKVDRKWIFVSGPEGFITYLAGPKRWEAGIEGQGELSGIIGRMRLRDWKVYKL